MPAFDYTIQTPDAFTSVAQGFQLGSAMRAQQEQRAMQEQQAQAAMAAEQARQQELNRFGQLPMDKVTAQDVFRVAQYMPADKVTALKDMMGQMTQEGQKRELDFASGVSSAYLAGKPEVAKQALLSKAEAARNSGNEQRAQELESIAEIGMIRPEVGLKAMVPMIAQLPEGKQVIENIFAAQKITGEVRKGEAEASEAESKAASAATAAKFSESKAIMDLRMSEEQIKKWAADTDIARQNVKIASMNAATAREGNSLKRQEMQIKLGEAVRERDDKLREKVGKVESARSSIDNTLNTIDKLFQNPAWKDVVGSLEGRMPESASMLDDAESDAIALINTIGSQVFLSAVKEAGSMTGLTEKEGEKLQSSLASLGRAQSEDAFEKNAREAQRLLIKGRKGLVSRYGVPDTVPDTPAVKPSGAEVDSILKKLGVK